MKQMLCLLFTIILFIPVSQAQSVFYPQDTSDISKGTYDVLVAQKPLQYISIGGFQTTANGFEPYPYVIEARMAPYFFLFKGREQQSPFLKRLSLIIEPEIAFRIRNEESFPVAPPSFKPKLITNFFLDKFKKNDKNHLFATLTLAHYSNGQQPPFINEDSTFNTINGNFSTNYAKIGLTYSRFLNKNNKKSFGFFNNALFTMTANYQKDGGLGNSIFQFDKSLDQADYGHTRASFRLQLKSGNVRFGRFLLSSYKTPEVYRLDTFYVCIDTTLADGKRGLCLYDVAVLQKSSSRKVRPKQIWNFTARVDHTRILDSDFNPNSTELTLGMTNPNWRSLGFMVKAYRGRDYMNITFLENITYVHAGITLDINKYEVPNTQYLPHVEPGDMVYGDGTAVSNTLAANLQSRLDNGEIELQQPFSLSGGSVPIGVNPSLIQNGEMGELYHNTYGTKVENTKIKKNIRPGLFNRKGKAVNSEQ